MKRPLIVAALVGAGLGVACTAVLAAFTARGSGAPTVHAASMPTGSAPSVSVSARDVTASWTQQSLSNGVAVAGYLVKRYPAAGGAAVSVGANCSGTVAALTCTELAVTPGSWKYTVTPAHGLWRGTESGLSSTAVVASPSVSLSSSLARPGQSLTANVSNFPDGVSVSFRIGSAAGTVIGGPVTTSSAAGSNGSASSSVTIPAGTSDGATSVYATTSSENASTSVTVDGTAPSVTTVIAPVGNTAAGGFITQGGSYYVYANVVETGSGVASVNANVSGITTSATSVTLTTAAGPTTVGGTSYVYRSAALTAKNPLSGTQGYTITAPDNAGNSNPVNGSVSVDNTAPTVSATTITTTSITPGSQYFVYANATDGGSGVNTVTADVHNITTGATAVSLTSSGGPFTVGTTSYTYRSAAQTADSTLSAGSKTYTVAATDGVGNASGNLSGSVNVTNPPPSISAVAIAHTTNTTSQGSLANGVSYYVYANVSGTGTLTVTANVSSITSGQTAVPLVAGSYSAFGNTYTYRSAQLTAGTLSGTPSYTVNATNSASQAATPVTTSVTVDNTPPTVTSITSGDNNGTVAANDTFVVTFSEAIDPGTVASTGTLQISLDNSSSAHVTFQISNLMGSSVSNLTSGWVKQNKTLSYPGTLALSNQNKTVTFTVTGGCTGNNCSNNIDPGALGTLAYVADTTLNDYAGNAPSGTVATTYPASGTIKVF